MSAKTVKKIKLDSSKSGKKTTVSADKPDRKAAKRNYNPLSAAVRYVKGSWHEIRQVRWPNRSATWGMTLAVIGFTIFFAVIILLIDSVFELLFKNFLLK